MAAFRYLTSEKSKQTKIKQISYEKLEIQKYLMDGNRNIDTSKFIFKARAKTLDIKTQKVGNMTKYALDVMLEKKLVMKY